MSTAGSASAAVELFVERARAVKPGFELDDAADGRGGDGDLPAARRDRVGDRAGRGADGVDEPAGRAGTVSSDRFRLLSGSRRRSGAPPDAASARCNGPTTCSTTTNGRCWAAVRCSPAGSTSPPPAHVCGDAVRRVRGVGPVGFAGPQVAGHRRAGRAAMPATACWRRSASSPKSSWPPPAHRRGPGPSRPLLRRAGRRPLGHAGTGPANGSRSIGSRSSSPISAPGSAGPPTRATSPPPPPSPPTPPCLAVRCSGSSRSGGPRRSSPPPPPPMCAQLPRLYTAASVCIVTGRPEAAVGYARAAVALGGGSPLRPLRARVGRPHGGRRPSPRRPDGPSLEICDGLAGAAGPRSRRRSGAGCSGAARASGGPRRPGRSPRRPWPPPAPTATRSGSPAR